MIKIKILSMRYLILMGLFFLVMSAISDTSSIQQPLLLGAGFLMLVGGIVGLITTIGGLYENPSDCG